jgi:hypothetical protein
MMPMEIGAAAAYEAYRQVKYGHNVYSFLYSDFERQREALRALAIAEGVWRTIFVAHLRTISESLSIGSISHTPRDFLLSRSFVAGHGPCGRPIWPTGCVRLCGSHSQ